MLVVLSSPKAPEFLLVEGRERQCSFCHRKKWRGVEVVLDKQGRRPWICVDCVRGLSEARRGVVPRGREKQ